MYVSRQESPHTPNLVNTMGWFEASFVQEIAGHDAHDVIDGDVIRNVYRRRTSADQYGDEEHSVESRGKRQLQTVDRGMLHVEFGRPSWDVVFPAVREAHPGQGIGVFCCGPMGKALRAACTKYSVFEGKSKREQNTVFKLHAEVF